MTDLIFPSLEGWSADAEDRETCHKIKEKSSQRSQKDEGRKNHQHHAGTVSQIIGHRIAARLQYHQILGQTQNGRQMFVDPLTEKSIVKSINKTPGSATGDVREIFRPAVLKQTR